jgi:hypothetical protein
MHLTWIRRPDEICFIGAVDASLTWKSLRVKGYMQALSTIPRERAEWFIWLDMDMVLENITFNLPLETYEGRDIIMWGQPEWIAKGDNARGNPYWGPIDV